MISDNAHGLGAKFIISPVKAVAKAPTPTPANISVEAPFLGPAKVRINIAPKMVPIRAVKGTNRLKPK